MKTKTLETHGGTFEVHIHENRIPRPLFSFNELKAAGVDVSDVDYIEGPDDPYGENCDNPQLFRYRGSVYDQHELQPAPDWIRELGYDAWQPESYFSAVVVAFFDRDGHEYDGEVVVGYIHW